MSCQAYCVEDNSCAMDDSSELASRYRSARSLRPFAIFSHPDANAAAPLATEETLDVCAIKERQGQDPCTGSSRGVPFGYSSRIQVVHEEVVWTHVEGTLTTTGPKMRP